VQQPQQETHRGAGAVGEHSCGVLLAVSGRNTESQRAWLLHRVAVSTHAQGAWVIRLLLLQETHTVLLMLSTPCMSWLVYRTMDP
jgi:hypothetical protein